MPLREASLPRRLLSISRQWVGCRQRASCSTRRAYSGPGSIFPPKAGNGPIPSRTVLLITHRNPSPGPAGHRDFEDAGEPLLRGSSLEQ